MKEKQAELLKTSISSAATVSHLPNLVKLTEQDNKEYIIHKKRS